MASLEEMRKVSINERHPNFWEIGTRYSLEAEWIYQYLKDEAALLWKQDKIQESSSRFENITQQILINYTDNVEASSDGVVAGSGIKERAKDGTLKNECPTTGTLILLGMALLFTVGIEFSVLLVQSFSDNPFIIVFALILASGGFFQGVGLGNYYYTGWLKETKRPNRDKKKSLPFLVVGSIIVLLIAGIRGYFGGVIIFLTTLVLGLLVCVAEAFFKYLSARRKQCLLDIEQAQKDFAAEMHCAAVKKGKYQQYFINEVKRFSNDGSTHGNAEEFFKGGAVS